MTGWCPYIDGTLKEAECHHDGYCSDCPYKKDDDKKETIGGNMTCPEDIKQEALKCCETWDCDNCPLWGVPGCMECLLPEIEAEDSIKVLNN